MKPAYRTESGTVPVMLGLSGRHDCRHGLRATGWKSGEKGQCVPFRDAAVCPKHGCRRYAVGIGHPFWMTHLDGKVCSSDGRSSGVLSGLSVASQNRGHQRQGEPCGGRSTPDCEACRRDPGHATARVTHRIAIATEHVLPKGPSRHRGSALLRGGLRASLGWELQSGACLCVLTCRLGWLRLR
ncbi:hypothetical protein TREES_T100017964 [Tupaia chinensis]|uniref:Uncharacterized protein n=1 Tax=Tupaia chinensis TaxID=246437 RepID=L9JQY0_TUPCH|nr:hypothetical protein TREES_T100017964 [Tupaia chinensis]